MDQDRQLSEVCPGQGDYAWFVIRQLAITGTKSRFLMNAILYEWVETGEGKSKLNESHTSVQGIYEGSVDIVNEPTWALIAIRGKRM